jgi:lysophospholipase L1-like esterase
MRRVVFVLLLATSLVGQAQQPPADHWVGTWSTAVVPSTVPPPAAGFRNPPAIAGQAFQNQTVRQIIHTSIGGPRVRVVLSNVFGTTPLTIGAASIAVRDKESAIVAATSRPLTFGGLAAPTIPAGAELFSDPVAMTVPAFADLAIDLFIPDAPAASTRTLHLGAFQTNYIADGGNHAGEAMLANPTTINSWFFLERVEVTAPPSTIGIVAFGDSITDGTGSTRDANNRWPDVLARRLGSGQAAIMIQAIAGNRLLSDAYAFGFGVPALARFDRDVLAQTGATHVVVLEGINDIGLGLENPSPSVDDLVAAYRQITMRAHARGLKAIAGTLLPFEGATYYRAAGETKRAAVNAWLRGKDSGFDGVIDFDAVTKDPGHPMQILPTLHAGDHLHPNDAGYNAMANAIDVKLFTPSAR